jgi:dipeptidyl aminopeptidase/acylaminoacyl peptidase
MRHAYPRLCSLLLIFLLTFSLILTAQEAETIPSRIPIKSWLLLGPFVTPLPAFHADEKGGFSAEDLLDLAELDRHRLAPRVGDALVWRDGRRAIWQELDAIDDGVLLAESKDLPSIAYMALYLDSERYTQAKLHLQSSQLYSVYLDGKLLLAKKDHTPRNGNKSIGDLKLETGKHMLLVKSVHDPGTQSRWNLNAYITLDDKFEFTAPGQSLIPQAHMDIGHLLDTASISNVSISPDGKMAGVFIRKAEPQSGGYKSWMELRSLPDGRLIREFRGGTAITNMTWAPGGNKFAYTTSDQNKTTIWITDLEAGTTSPFLRGISGFAGFVWGPSGSYMIYSKVEEGGKDIQGVKHFRDLPDRIPGWRNRTYLYKASIPDCFCQRLTAGEMSSYLSAVSPDGKRMVFTRPVIDNQTRPFSQTEIYIMDLTTLKYEMLLKGSWLGTVQWTPQGDGLLILGGPSAFGEIGLNLPRGVTANEYDSQAYLYNLETKKAICLTKTFNPSIDSAFWGADGNSLYFVTGDRSFRRLYRYDLRSRNFLAIDTGVEVIGSFDFAKDVPMAVYSGSSASVPSKAYSIDLASYKFHTISDPSQPDFTDLSFGRVDRWTFKNKKNQEIEGRVYYPPDFDPEHQYPCIVYYYGGTSPVTRDFGGRYPKNLWAAQGYVIYVLQPSGATGFGQEFSAAHVNDWGIVVADEIISGVGKFLDAHPFVDGKRVGAIGASFGGFMTMLLQTRTKIFRAAVAHAGISSISSYWGEGYWGYSYSAFATAGSFPWNRKDIYVTQSPLFNADKITTPLLLLHGAADTNVPPGESTQLYTALKLLGREVEYIQIEDQDHHILQYNKRKLWTKTIMAWFDKYLKNQPEWWASLYPNR